MDKTIRKIKKSPSTPPAKKEPANQKPIDTIIPNLNKWSLADIINPKNASLLSQPAATQRLITDNGAPSIGGHNS